MNAELHHELNRNTLDAIMHDYKLTKLDAARLLGVEISTVENYLRPATSKAHRTISRAALDKLQRECIK